MILSITYKCYENYFLNCFDSVYWGLYVVKILALVKREICKTICIFEMAHYTFLTGGVIKIVINRFCLSSNSVVFRVR